MAVPAAGGRRDRRAGAVVPVVSGSAVSGLVLVGDAGAPDRVRVVGRADHLVALDFDQDVVDIVSQPFWLVWRDERGKQRHHAPDFLVRLTGGRRLVSVTLAER